METKSREVEALENEGPPEAEELLGSVFALGPALLTGAKKHFQQKRRGRRTVDLGTLCSRCAWEQIELLWPHLPFGIPPHVQGPGRRSHLLCSLSSTPTHLASPSALTLLRYEEKPPQ